MIPLFIIYFFLDLLEPISIRNWFSSYVYESPTLDTNDGFRDSLSKESECEEGGFIVEESNRDKAEDDCGLFRRIRRRDDAENSNGLGNCDKTCQDNKHEKQTSNKVLILYRVLPFCCPFHCYFLGSIF